MFQAEMYRKRMWTGSWRRLAAKKVLLFALKGQDRITRSIADLDVCCTLCPKMMAATLDSSVAHVSHVSVKWPAYSFSCIIFHFLCRM